MIANYSDPIVTLNQVYKASEEGSVPTLGACVIGPHYIVRKYEDFGKALQLNSSDNYSSDYSNAYTYAGGLGSRPYPARGSSDGDVDAATAKVLVKNAPLNYKTFSGAGTVFTLSDGNDTLSVKVNGNSYVFKDPYSDGSEVVVQAGDIVELTISDSVDASDSAVAVSCEVLGFMKDSSGNYTKCVLSKTLPENTNIVSAMFFRVKDCYIGESYVEATASQIAVDAAAHSEPLDLGNGEKVAYPIYGGALYAEYRIYSTRFVSKYGQVADIDYVDDLLGKVCPENPLGIAVANAVEESEGNFVYFIALEKDATDEAEMVEAYEKALDLIADKDGIYGIVPCTDNKAVAKALLQFVEKQSAEEIPYFKYLYASKEIPSEEKLLPTSDVSLTITAVASDSTEIAGTVTTKVTFSGSPLLNIGTLVKGDVLKYGNYEAEIVSSNHKNIIWLDGNRTATLTTSSAAEIYKTLTDNADIIESIIEWKDIANKRCSICIADGAVYNSTMAVPNYCVAAALAGKRSGTYAHAPLSNVTMKAITTTDAHGFTTSMSKKLGSAGFWRVGMNENGECISRRQLTSAATGDVNYDEQSIVCDIDSIGLSLKVTGRDLVGNTNISPALLDILEAELNNKLLQFQTYVNDFIGPQLLSGTLLSLKQDTVYKDRIYAELEGEPPKPFNRFHIGFYMR